MPDTNLNINYGTQAQVEYARAMAKFLREKKGFQMTPGMAVLPGSWAHSVPDVIDAISQGRYQDIAGQQDRTLAKRTIDPGYVSENAPSTVGSSLSQSLKQLYNKYKSSVNNKIITPGTEPKELVTGSLSPTDANYLDTKDQINYADLVKQTENPALYSGKTDKSRAQWDFQQHTNGYGTKAKHEEEVIDKSESDRRFTNEWQKAQNQVDQFKPGLPLGPRAALTSLTFNSGTKWMDQGLGSAVQSDDPEKAKNLFLQYNTALDKRTGQRTVLAGLKERRDREAKWFDDVTPSIGGMPQAPNDKMTGMMNLGKGAEEPPAVLAAGPQRQQVAQAYGTQPVQNPAPSPPIQGANGGYQGAIPPRNPVSTDAQLDAQIMAAGTPEQRQAIIDQHKKDIEGRQYKTPGGGTLNVPGGPNGQVTHIPGQDIPLGIAGMNLHMRQNPDGSFGLILPGGGTKDFGTVNDLLEYARQQKAKDATAVGTAEEQVKHYQTEQQTIQAQGEKSKLHLPQLNIIQNLIKDPANYVGYGVDKVLDAKKILDAMGMGNPTMSQPASMEVLQKLIASSNLAAMEQLRGFGQVRSTDLRWLEQSNATTTNRPEAINALADMAKRMHKRSVDIQNLAQEYRDKHEGNLDVKWDKHLSQWTRDNPLFEKEDIEKYNEKLKPKIKGETKKEEITTPTPSPSQNIGPRIYVPGKGWQ